MSGRDLLSCVISIHPNLSDPFTIPVWKSKLSRGILGPTLLAGFMPLDVDLFFPGLDFESISVLIRPDVRCFLFNPEQCTRFAFDWLRYEAWCRNESLTNPSSSSATALIRMDVNDITRHEEEVGLLIISSR